MEENDSIKLSPKHGLNAAIVVCPICGNETNALALLGQIDKKDSEAPKYIPGEEFCDDCKSHIGDGGMFILEVDKEQNRTGRYAKLPKEFKEENKLEDDVMLMYDNEFEKVFCGDENENN